MNDFVVVKVQQNKTNVTINLNKCIRKIFPVEKGDFLKVQFVDGKLVIEKIK